VGYFCVNFVRESEPEIHANTGNDLANRRETIKPAILFSGLD